MERNVDRGYSFTEVMVAMVILGFAALMVALVLSTSTKFHKTSFSSDDAYAIARERLAMLQDKGRTVFVNDSTEVVRNDINYKISWDIDSTKTSDRADIKVRWIMGSNVKEVGVSGYIESRICVEVPGNHTPSDIIMSPGTPSLYAGQPSGTMVATFSTIDVDSGSGDIHRYSLVSGSGSTHNSSFSIRGVRLFTDAVLTAGTKSIRVQTEDCGGKTIQEIFSIVVTTTTEPPEIENQEFDVDENSSDGHSVGYVVATPSGLAFSITSESVTGVFAIGSSTGEITVSDNQDLDYEQYTVMYLTVEVSDGSSTASATMTININNVNEAPTDIALSNTSVNEGEPTGTTVGSFSTTDPDAGDNHSYSLVTGTGSDDNSSFTIDGNILKTAEVFDCGVKSVYSIRVCTTDEGLLYFEKQFTITVNESCEGGSGTILREWWAGISGKAVSNLTSNSNYPDNPSGSNEPTSFEAPTSFGDNYGTRMRGFVHPPTTGSYKFWVASDDNSELWLSTDETPENAVKIAYVSGSNAWTVEHEWDKFTSQESSSRTLTACYKYYIEVLHKEGTGGDNLAVAWQGPGISQAVIEGQYLSPWTGGTAPNNAPTNISISSSDVDENEAIGTVVGTFSTTDPDVGDSHVYTLVSGTGSDDNSSFSIDGSSLKTAAVFDYSIKSIYSIRVRTTDQGNLWFEKQFTITVNEAVGCIVEADFNTTTDGFTYQDDTFRGTNNPNKASGVREASGGYSGTGGLNVTLGNIGTNMSGGWSKLFNLSSAGTVTLSFRYRLYMHVDYESDEYSEVLASIDGTLYGTDPNDYVVRKYDAETDWQLFEKDINLSSGSHTLIIGGYNNKSTQSTEVTDIWIDDVSVCMEEGGEVPDAPSGLNAEAVSQSQINLTWTDNSDNETGFKIERKTTGSFSEIATVGANVTSYNNTGLSASTQYTYRVRAYNGEGNSNYSNEASATTQEGGVCDPGECEENPITIELNLYYNDISTVTWFKYDFSGSRTFQPKGENFLNATVEIFGTETLSRTYVNEWGGVVGTTSDVGGSLLIKFTPNGTTERFKLEAW